jgi:hypothetical protein
MKKYIVLFDSGIEIECADNHKFIMYDQSERFCKDLEEGDCVISNNKYDFVFDVFELDEYENFYDLSLEYHNLYFTNGILSHNSNVLTNMASRQVLNGLNPVIMTLEMSEDVVCQRLDAIHSKLDMNRIYINDETSSKMVKSLKEMKSKHDLGQL